MNKRRKQPEKCSLNGRIIHDTGNAILMLVVSNTGAGHRFEKEVWFPMSTVHSLHRTFATLGYDTLVVEYWIARDRGLVHDLD